MPPVLYKYVDVESAIKIIGSKSFKLRTICDFNDPFEFAPACPDGNIIGVDHNSIKSLANSLEQEGYVRGSKDFVIAFIDKLITDNHLGKQAYGGEVFGYLMSRCVMLFIACTCFSEESDNILMWSHYADGHSGVCIGIDTSNHYFRKVEYADSKITCNNNIIAQNDPNPTISYAEIVARTKSKQWEYEKEWRFIGTIQNSAEPRKAIEAIYKEGQLDFYIRRFQPLDVKSLYFGVKMPDNDRKKLLGILKDFPTAEIYDMKEDLSNFKLVSQRLTDNAR